MELLSATHFADADMPHAFRGPCAQADIRPAALLEAFALVPPRT